MDSAFQNPVHPGGRTKKSRGTKSICGDDVGVETTDGFYKVDTRSRFRLTSDKFLQQSRSLFEDKTMEDEVSEEDKAWLKTLSDVDLDLLISIKQLAMKRAKTINNDHIKGIFGFKVLRTIGLLLKELVVAQAEEAGILTNTSELKSDDTEIHKDQSTQGRVDLSSDEVRDGEELNTDLAIDNMGKLKRKNSPDDEMKAELKKVKI